MKKPLLLIFLLASLSLQAQFLIAPPEGGNKKASISEQIGLTQVQIEYNRPAVKGREGKIWGQLVHFGFADLGFGTSKAAPWRVGANENTTISFSTDVKIEGRELLAGKYALFMAVQPEEVTVIFSKNSSSWGSYFYDPSEDALRVSVKPLKEQPSVERLRFEFNDQTENAALVNLLWERWKIAFKVEVDLPKTVLDSFRKQLRNEPGFMWQCWNQAAAYCLRYNTNLEEGLVWANKAISEPYIGEVNFQNLNLKAQIQNRLGRNAEADATMKDALKVGNMQELHQYARELLSQKRNVEALEVFRANATRNPNTYTTNMGLARGYAANADLKNALKYAKQAELQAGTNAEKEGVAKALKLLNEGKDFNQ